MVTGAVDGIGVGGWGAPCKSEKVGLEINDAAAPGRAPACAGCRGGCHCCAADHDEAPGRAGRGGRAGGGADGTGHTAPKAGSLGSSKETDAGRPRAG